MAENNTDNATSLKQIFQSMYVESMEIVRGIVKSASPLQIQIENDEKLLIDESVIYVPKHLTNYVATIDIVDGAVNGKTATDGSHTHSYSGKTENGEVPAHNHSYNGTTGDGGDPIHTHSYNGTTNNGGNSTHSHTYDGETQGKAHSHSLSEFSIFGATMTVYNALKAGETVHLLSFNHGKQYYVLDRVS